MDSIERDAYAKQLTQAAGVPAYPSLPKSFPHGLDAKLFLAIRSVLDEPLSQKMYKEVRTLQTPLNRFHSDVRTLDQLISMRSATLEDMSGFGKDSIANLENELSFRGLRVNLAEQVKWVRNYVGHAAGRPEASYTTLDQPTVVSEQLLPTGIIVPLADSKEAIHFYKQASALFKRAEGNHRDGARLESSYFGSIQRLPGNCIYISDAALQALSTCTDRWEAVTQPALTR